MTSVPGLTRGFTLIEILIAVAIGSLIVAMTWSTLHSLGKVARRYQAATSLHQQASVIHSALETQLTTQFHGAQFRIHVSDAGTRNAAITIDCMYQQSEIEPMMGRFSPRKRYYNDLVWSRLRWHAGGASGPPTLSRAISPPRWQVVTTDATRTGIASNVPRRTDCVRLADPYKPLHLVPEWVDEELVLSTTGNSSLQSWLLPEPRRDRQRDINDNDLRLMPGIPASVYNSLGLSVDYSSSRLGDGDRLTDELILVSDRISRFRVEVIDFRGFRTVVNPTPDCYEDPEPPPGISYYDATGAVITPLTPIAPHPDVWSSSLRTVDGLWSDGRGETSRGYAGLPPPSAERPAVVRIAFVLHAPMTGLAIPANSDANPLKNLDFLEYDRRRPGGNQYISREFAFSFSTSSFGVEP